MKTNYNEVHKLEFKTKKEAESEAGRINQYGMISPTMFCPLRDGNCRTDCVCWEKVRPVATKNVNVFGLTGFYCGNEMFE